MFTLKPSEFAHPLATGTSLFENNKSPALHTFKYKCNNGYALLNNDFSFHGTEYSVVNNVRKSMYVRYS